MYVCRQMKHMRQMRQSRECVCQFILLYAGIPEVRVSVKRDIHTHKRDLIICQKRPINIGIPEVRMVDCAVVKCMRQMRQRRECVCQFILLYAGIPEVRMVDSAVVNILAPHICQL